jgi:membrane-bound lytic murein transglycosylase D
MLERLAEAQPPDLGDASAATSPESEAVALRGMFDIDVANWLGHGRVRYYLGFFTGIARERMAIWLRRVPRYEPTIRTQLIARGLPGDLAYLPLIESGYSATAVSRSRAVGMWQFMRGTARFYGLKMDRWVDERRDVPKATDAAIRFLADLTAKFGSPYLAAAAYNGGPGRIQRGLARLDPTEEEEAEDPDAEDDGSPQPGDAAFFQLADTRYIHRETKDYVPKLIAAAMIAKQPQRYGFARLAAAEPPPPDSVMVTDATGLDVIAHLGRTPVSDLWDLNPALVRPVTPPGRRMVVRVPSGTGPAIQAALDSLPGSKRIATLPHRTRRGETLARIGTRYGVTTGQLRELNPGLAKRAPRRGEEVRIPGRARMKAWIADDKRAEAAARARPHRAHPGKAIRHQAQKPAKPAAKPSRVATRSGTASKVHVVKAGETLSSLARTCGATVADVRAANRMPPGRTLLAGQRITIPC